MDLLSEDLKANARVIPLEERKHDRTKFEKARSALDLEVVKG